MSKRNLIITIAAVLGISIIAIIFLIVNANSVSERGNQGATNNISILDNYDSNYKAEDVFADGIPDIKVKFGNDGTPYIAKLEDNETALELARNITTYGRNLPIYNYDNFEGYEYFQYYDIPSSYRIPSNPTLVTSEKAGEIYYASPNRVILFYKDAQIEGNYTKIGQIEDITNLAEDVENNPVLVGWGNKIISIEYAEN